MGKAEFKELDLDSLTDESLQDSDSGRVFATEDLNELDLLGKGAPADVAVDESEETETTQEGEAVTTEGAEGNNEGTTETSEGGEADIEQLLLDAVAETEGTGEEVKEENVEESNETETETGEEQNEQEEITEVDIDTVLSEIENLTNEIQNQNDAIENSVSSSGMGDSEKGKLAEQLSKQQDFIDDLLLKHESLKKKYVQAAQENEDYKLSSAGNSKLLRAFEEDPDVQEYVSMKIKANNGDDRAQKKLVEFAKGILSNNGYDVDSIVNHKLQMEKEGMAGMGASGAGTVPKMGDQGGDIFDKFTDQI